MLCHNFVKSSGRWFINFGLPEGGLFTHYAPVDHIICRWQLDCWGRQDFFCLSTASVHNHFCDPSEKMLLYVQFNYLLHLICAQCSCDWLKTIGTFTFFQSFIPHDHIPLVSSKLPIAVDYCRKHRIDLFFIWNMELILWKYFHDTLQGKSYDTTNMIKNLSVHIDLVELTVFHKCSLFCSILLCTSDGVNWLYDWSKWILPDQTKKRSESSWIIIMCTYVCIQYTEQYTQLVFQNEDEIFNISNYLYWYNVCLIDWLLLFLYLNSNKYLGIK